MKKILLLINLIILSLVSAGITYAAETTGTIDVSVSVVGDCTVTVSPVNFGTVNGLDVSPGTGDVTVNCPDTQTYNIALDAGLHYGDLDYRYVASGSYEVLYVLTQEDDSGGTEWGDPGFGNTYPWGSTVQDTGNGSNQPHTVYGFLRDFVAIPNGTTLTDTVTVTVHY